MGNVENDETKGIARPFVILAHERTGGTFCAHALSNHPQIFCDRGEVMHHASLWRQKSGMKPGKFMRFIWAQTGYHAAGFRLHYLQAASKRVWPAVVARKAYIIHLRRRSLVRQALSSAYNFMVRADRAKYHPVHSFRERTPPKQTLPPPQALYRMRRLAGENEAALQRVKNYAGPVLEIFYEDMVGNAPTSADEMARDGGDAICEFLGVQPLAMRVDLRRDFPVPTPAMFANWDEIEAALREAGYGDAVDYELRYWESIWQKVEA